MLCWLTSWLNECVAHAFWGKKKQKEFKIVEISFVFAFMLMLMPLQQLCVCVIWVCASVSASALFALVFLLVLSAFTKCCCLRLKVCYKKYFMTCKSINKKVQPTYPASLFLPPPTHSPWLPCLVYCQRCHCGRALSFAQLVTHFIFLHFSSFFFFFWVMFHVFHAFRILLLCWPFGSSSFNGKLHLSMC